MNQEAIATLNAIAVNLGVNKNDLFKLIRFESKWNPLIKNPRSSARGLIQFTDKTARSLGYNNSYHLVTTHPTISSQLPVVHRYLSQFKPFTDKQSLYLSVFYPAARYWNPNKLFPKFVRDVNPGVNTPGDYIKLVEGRKGGAFSLLPLALAVAVFIYTTIKRKDLK